MVDELYFSWLISNVTCPPITHLRLLKELYSVSYVWNPCDENSAVHGIDLRRIYSQRTGRTPLYLPQDRPSILELLVSMAMRMEEIVSDPGRGDRTSQWFWSMIVNLGLGNQTDDRFNEYVTRERLGIFMNRSYSSNGSGGNIYIFNNTDVDVTKVSLQLQMCWYLDEKG